MSISILNEIKKQRDNVFVDQRLLDDLEQKHLQGKMSDQEIQEMLSQINPDRAFGTFQVEWKSIADEWSSLLAVLEESENRVNHQAKRQFNVGLITLPLFIFLSICSLFIFKWHEWEHASVVSSVLGASLLAIAAHSFFLLRIQQQASLAAERLSEKRLGILFIKLAASQDKNLSSAQLLEAGTSMFLGHHAPNTVPLQPEDFSASTKVK